MTESRVAFVTTCRGRRQHLERTLPQNIRDNPGALFIVLDYNSNDGLVDYLRLLLTDNWSVKYHERLIVYSFPWATQFKMAHAKNMAHRLGLLEGADILVNVDADNYTPLGFADYVRERFKNNTDSFCWARMIKDGPGRLSRGISGRIAVTRDMFLNSGGYDEQYEKWGPDDRDFSTRLQRMGYRAQEIDSKYLSAVRHNERMRFREYPGVERSNHDDFDKVDDSEATVRNYGRIGLGTVYRNFSSEPIELERLPTRIFGIGLHKTATTSLHQALQILGFNSAHWKSAHWAKAIWEEMQAWGRSHTLEKSYALVDLPIPILFKELDQAYQGSKFILTIRDERRWLRSVRAHWSHEANKFRAQWGRDPFTHKIHKIVYGQKGFDETIMLNRYRHHNAQVTHYFRYRPNDLLVMDVERGDGWPQLCAFLKCPIPSASYPLACQTSNNES